jgi:hypothetical protein
MSEIAAIAPSAKVKRPKS